MIQQRLKEWIEHPEMLDKNTLYELRTVLAHYPYFQTARLLYLKNLFLLHDIGFGEELRRSALYIPDRRVLFSLVEGDNYTLKVTDFMEKAGDAPGLDRTLLLIDAFLSSLPEKKMPADEVLPIEMATDYTAYLMQDRKEEQPDLVVEVPQMKGQQLIDNFLDTSEEQPLISSITDGEEEYEDSEELKEKEDEEDYFTETLAKIYVKQQRYSKALEIIQRLNLKYPKKNAYFADQIRFLEKLIINSKFK